MADWNMFTSWSTDLMTTTDLVSGFIKLRQGPKLKFKAMQDFSRLFEKEIQDCFNDMYF